MNKTKKGFLKAGSIIAIVSASIGMLVSLGLMLIGNFITEDVLKESYKDDPIYTYYENSDGSYYFTYEENGVIVTMDDDEVTLIANIAQGIVSTLSVFSLGFAVATLVLGIKVLINANKELDKKGCIIALLVLSALTSNMLTLVFMIVSLCMKEQPKIEPNLDNINEIAEEISKEE